MFLSVCIWEHGYWYVQGELPLFGNGTQIIPQICVLSLKQICLCTELAHGIPTCMNSNQATIVHILGSLLFSHVDCTRDLAGNTLKMIAPVSLQHVFQTNPPTESLLVGTVMRLLLFTRCAFFLSPLPDCWVLRTRFLKIKLSNYLVRTRVCKSFRTWSRSRSLKIDSGFTAWLEIRLPACKKVV